MDEETLYEAADCSTCEDHRSVIEAVRRQLKARAAFDVVCDAMAPQAAAEEDWRLRCMETDDAARKAGLGDE